MEHTKERGVEYLVDELARISRAANVSRKNMRNITVGLMIYFYLILFLKFYLS